jgi:hypothetical protein
MFAAGPYTVFLWPYTPSRATSSVPPVSEMAFVFVMRDSGVSPLTDRMVGGAESFMPTLPVEVMRRRSVLPVFQMCSVYPASYTVEPACVEIAKSQAQQ